MIRANYHFRSFLTRSYWGYALFTIDSLTTFVAVVAGTWSIIDILDSFQCLDKQSFSIYLLIPLFLFGIISVVITRRPVKKISYKYPGQDLTIEVIIDDLFKVPGQKIISTNTTFDTDINSGIISQNSLQGQFTQMYFPSDLPKLNHELDQGLSGLPHRTVQKQSGKTERYELGTTVKFNLSGQFFYWFAMSDLNVHNNAKTTLNNVTYALDELWTFIDTKGEKMDTVIPCIGSGLGRLTTSRKKLIAIIAQSFINASEGQIFSNKLTIVVYPGDVKKSNLNLFEVKDLLHHYLP